MVEHGISLNRNLNFTNFVLRATGHGILKDLRFELNRTDRSVVHQGVTPRRYTFPSCFSQIMFLAV